MLPIQYTYFLGASLFLIPWILIFVIRKDLRTLLKEIGFLFVFLGLFCEYFWWTKDWWKPYTITNTIIGVEDIILGFVSAGVAASLYLVFFKKKFVENTKIILYKRRIIFVLIIGFNLLLFAFLFRFLRMNSFLCSLITSFIASLIFLIQKRELIIPALINGVLMVILVVPIFLMMMLVTPAFIERTWITDKLLGIYFLNIPIEDCIFYFLSGVFCFSGYAFYRNLRLKDL